MTARILTTKTIPAHGLTTFLLPAGVQARDAIRLKGDVVPWVGSPPFNARTPSKIGLVFGMPEDGDERPQAPRRYTVVPDGTTLDGGRWRHVRSLVDWNGVVLHILEECGP